MENFTNKISRLELENFTCFAKADMDFSSGINVFIGENGTGKTHILKVLYAMNYAASKIEIKPNDDEKGTNSVLFNPYNFISEMAFTFGTTTWIDLIKDIDISNTSFKTTFFKGLEFGLGFLKGELAGLKLTLSDIDIESPIYIPPYEMLSNAVLSNDKIYYDLVKALNIKKREADLDILKAINELVSIQVEKKEDTFYIGVNKRKSVKANLSANGINKIGQLIPLIQNGSLNKDTILFWDEPETNLNPKYIKIVAKFLQILAKNGVQIFVATHDYYLSHLLSLNAEYREQTDAPPIKFFSLSKGENGTEIESADTIAWLKNNAIVEEYAHFYDLESQLFADTMKKPEFA